MSFIQKIEEFMRDLFLERISEEKKILANRAGYRQKFFAVDCLWDSRVHNLAMLETERVVKIESSGASAMVITEYQANLPKISLFTYRRRFHLEAVEDHWLIRLVEAECLACHGQGDESCMSCQGKHWI